MANKLTISAIVIVLISSFSSNAWALSILDPGVVGAISGKLANSSPPSEMAAAQFLLDMLAMTTDSNGPAAGASACNISTADGCYATSNTEYAATLSSPVQSTIDGHDNTVNAGFMYALAKYDGPNAGYVLFFLNGAATTLPEYPFPLWGDNASQYQISHHTGFNAVQVNQTSVPDGGTTLTLLGAALGGLGLVRRRLKA